MRGAKVTTDGPRRLIKPSSHRGGFVYTPDEHRPMAILKVDGRLVLWQVLSSCLGKNDTPQSALASAVEDLANNGRTVERIKWL